VPNSCRLADTTRQQPTLNASPELEIPIQFRAFMCSITYGSRLTAVQQASTGCGLHPIVGVEEESSRHAYVPAGARRIRVQRACELRFGA
jgi:hypothetical protein